MSSDRREVVSYVRLSGDFSAETLQAADSGPVSQSSCGEGHRRDVGEGSGVGPPGVVRAGRLPLLGHQAVRGTNCDPTGCG